MAVNHKEQKQTNEQKRNSFKNIFFYQRGLKREKIMLKYITSCYMANSQNEFLDKIKYSKV